MMGNRLRRGMGREMGKAKAKLEAGAEDGFTMVELMIASAIFAVILVITLQVVNSFEVAGVNVTNRANATSSALTAMNRIGKDIRNAVVSTTSTSPVLLAAPNALTIITTDGNGNVIEAQFSVSYTNGACPCTLNETSAPYDTVASTTTTPVSYRFSIANLTSDQIFSYYPYPSGTATPPSTFAMPTTTSVPATGITNPQFTSIASIGVTLTVEPLKNQPTATAFDIFSMRNVAFALAPQ